MTAARRTLQIHGSPHVFAAVGVDRIMRQVLLALLPGAAWSVYVFGLAALVVLLTAFGTCVLVEHVLCRWAGRPTTVGDGSAALTGLLLGMSLPPGLPLWMVAVGAALSIGVGKAVFGGLGANPFNPALVGRAILQAAFPVAMTTWVSPIGSGRMTSLPTSTLAFPFVEPAYDALSGPTPLLAWKAERIASSAADLAIGGVAGSVGETSALFLLAGGGYLVARGVMGWRIPLTILSTVAVMSGALHLVDPDRFASPLFMLLSGGLVLGAVFMATDMVGSPMTEAGGVVYGVVIGALVVVIRVFGGMPEGVMYAVLLGNALTPLIDQWMHPRVFGVSKRRSAA
jgi:electron transport complex protein RnfD